MARELPCQVNAVDEPSCMSALVGELGDRLKYSFSGRFGAGGILAAGHKSQDPPLGSGPAR
jgi:hypothetical protein